MSLARAFLAAGVPAVVATLGNVPDEQTEIILDLFHQQLSSGDDAMSALRKAQLAFLKRPEQRQFLTWAVFQVIGGVVTPKGERDG